MKHINHQLHQKFSVIFAYLFIEKVFGKRNEQCIIHYDKGGNRLFYFYTVNSSVQNQNHVILKNLPDSNYALISTCYILSPQTPPRKPNKTWKKGGRWLFVSATMSCAIQISKFNTHYQYPP